MSSFNGTSGKKKNIEIETKTANSFTVVSNKTLQIQRLDTDPKETSRGSRTSAETIAWARHGRSSWWYSLDRQPRRCHVVQQIHTHTQTHAYGHIQLCKHGHTVGQNLARYRSHEPGSGGSRSCHRQAGQHNAFVFTGTAGGLPMRHVGLPQLAVFVRPLF